MSDRLNELKRQRALMQEHVAWLDREIAAESARSASANPAAPSTPAAAPAAPLPAVPAAPAPKTAPAPPAPAPDADEIMARFGYDPKSTQADVKRGCWIAFLAAFAAVGMVLVLWYLFRSG